MGYGSRMACTNVCVWALYNRAFGLPELPSCLPKSSAKNCNLMQQLEIVSPF